MAFGAAIFFTDDAMGPADLGRALEERGLRSLWAPEHSHIPVAMTWPKPVQKPHPPVIVGGAFPYGARRAIACGDGWVPHACRPALRCRPRSAARVPRDGHRRRPRPGDTAGHALRCPRRARRADARGGLA